MMKAMLRELELVSKNSEHGKKVSTIYFGGGTPSLLNIGEIKEFFLQVKNLFEVDANAEVTLEANPDDINQEKLAHWLNIGINRLSIGVQSFFEDDLRWMNRAHNSNQALQSIIDVKAAGFNNFSIDLIYGSPFLTNEQWKRNVQTILELNVPHISSYALTVEQGTALDKMIISKKSLPVEQEKQAEQFVQLMDWLHGAGYEHYEISNFALPGMRSRHNSSYWKGIPYIGIGPSAHSYNGKSRRWNIANNAIYIKQIEAGILPFEEENLTNVQRLNEYLMISLRTKEGIDLYKVQDEFGADYKSKLEHYLQKYVSSGKIIHDDRTIQLTQEGKLFADGIASDLFMQEPHEISNTRLSGN